MKRKRSSFEENSANDQDAMHEPSPKATKLYEDNATNPPIKLDVEIRSGISAVDRDLQIIADAAMSASNGEQPMKPQALSKPKHKRGKRKGKRTPNDEPANAENAGSGLESTAEHGGSAEAIYSNEEDAQTENMAEGVEAENPIKMEERKCAHDPAQWKILIHVSTVVEKKTAMDSLSFIEKCFARLRDK